MDEQLLIDGCKRGETSARKELYELYAPAMMSVCARYVRDRETAGSPDISWGELHSLSWNIYRYYNRLVQAWKLIRKRSCHICILVKADNIPAFTV